MADIIKFPTKENTNANSEPEKKSEIEYAQEVSEIILHCLFEHLYRLGYDIKGNKEILMPEVVLVIESVKAFYLKSRGLYHPMQEIAQEIYDSLDK